MKRNDLEVIKLQLKQLSFLICVIGGIEVGMLILVVLWRFAF